MSLRFTRFSETLDVDHNESNGNSTSEPSSQSAPLSTKYLCHTKSEIVVFIVVAPLIIFILVAGISFLVKCDEDKLISHFEDRRTTFEKAISDWAENHQNEKLNTEENYKSQKIRWVPGSQFDEHIMEPAGNELYGKGTLLLYVARASHLNGTVVGKYCPRLKKMFIGYDGQEPKKLEFELLTFPRGTLSWIHANSTISRNENDLVYGGAAPVTGESTYICRGKTQGHLIIGKFLQSSGRCLVAYMKTEFGLYNFEILTVNEMGRIIGVEA